MKKKYVKENFADIGETVGISILAFIIILMIFLWSIGIGTLIGHMLYYIGAVLSGTHPRFAMAHTVNGFSNISTELIHGIRQTLRIR